MPRFPAGAAARPRLSRERVLRAAIRRADREGIASLSMRTLASDLGAKPMSLYFYVRKKDDILAGMLDIVVSEFELPVSGASWRSAIRQSLLSAHDTLLGHRWACPLLMGTTESLAPVRYMEALLKTLRAGGFSAAMTHHAYHVLDSHLIGFTLWETGHASDVVDRAKAFVGGREAAAFPYVVEHAHEHFAGASRGDQPEFEFGLDLLLDALERVRTGGGAPPAGRSQSRRVASAAHRRRAARR